MKRSLSLVMAGLLTCLSASAGIRRVSTGTPPTAPSLSLQPFSWTTVVAGQNDGFVTSSVSDPDSVTISYTFDWGDGTTASVGPYQSNDGTFFEASSVHAWTALGTYNVRAKATDAEGNASPWSNTITVNVIPNAPPSAPALTGPTVCLAVYGSPVGGTPGASLGHYYVRGAVDPTGEAITSCQVDWGDGTTGTFSNSGTGGLNHPWKTPGSYSARARVSDPEGNWSAWSLPLVVTVYNQPILTGALAHDTSKLGPGVQAGDRVVLFFSSLTTRIPVTTANIDACLPVAGKSWGTIRSAVWRIMPNPPTYMGVTPNCDGLEVTFAGSGTTVAPGDPITVNSSSVSGGLDSSLVLGGSFDRWLRGDANGDGKFTAADIVTLQNYAFNGLNPPAHLVNVDVNSDGQVTAADIVRLIDYIFNGLNPPLQDNF